MFEVLEEIVDGYQEENTVYCKCWRKSRGLVVKLIDSDRTCEIILYTVWEIHLRLVMLPSTIWNGEEAQRAEEC